MTDFKTVPLKDIHPDPDQPRKFFDKGSLDELVQSVKKDGVLEPIMLRPNGKGFIIVYGERRFKAAQAAGLADIPAQIRELSADEAFEFQITENLHRKDVHPMEEANSYARLQKKDPEKNTVKELATRFAKSEIYITQRLSFNNLIPEFQKDFFEGKFMTGHAVILSRLTKDDQYLVRKNVSKDSYGSVEDLDEFIERQITNILSKASFKTDDATLYPAAGACTNCPKRSGGNHLLFPDVKEKDRCFDKKCFDKKTEISFNARLKEIIETRPDIHLVQSRYQDANKAAVAFAKELGVKVLSEDEGFDDNNYGAFRKKAQGFYLNGWHRGEIRTIYLKGSDKVDKDGKKIKGPDKPAGEQIKDIQKREVRNKELDLEKIHRATLEKLEKVAEMKKPGVPFQPVDKGIMIYLLLHAGDYRFEDQVRKCINLPKDSGKRHSYNEEYIQALSKISDGDLAVIIRQLAWNKYGNRNLISGIDTEDSILRLIAKYMKVDIAAIESEQNAIAAKRAERVKKRISDLQEAQSEKKKTESAKPVKKKAVKTAPPPRDKSKKSKNKRS